MVARRPPVGVPCGGRYRDIGALRSASHANGVIAGHGVSFFK